MQQLLARADTPYVATCPRQILPDQTAMITIRAVGRSFRFVPLAWVIQVILYCMFRAAKKFGVAVHEFVWLSNHCHILLTDKQGRLPDFARDMNSLISKNLNSMRGWSGTNFEKGYNMVVDTDPESVLRHAAYILANPCAADLVALSKHWKGASSWKLEYGKKFVIRRPKLGIWARTKKKTKNRKRKKASFSCEPNSPEEIVGVLERPPMFEELSDTELRARIRAEVARLEAAASELRKKNKKKLLGWQGVIAQHWNDIPREKEELFGAIPKVAAACEKLRREALERLKAFVQSYRQAMARYIEETRKDLVEFPEGTWLMRVRFQVKCGASPP